MTQLDLKGVSRWFGGVRAVSDVSMTVRSGSVTGLIGPNGAGKSTIINLITGMLKLSAGTVELDGVDTSNDPPHLVSRRGIARTFQNIRLMKEATVLENVLAASSNADTSSLLAKCLGLPSAKRFLAGRKARARAFLEETGIPHQASYLAGNLAYGDQRRVEIARALSLEGKVLLLDEPAAGMNDVEAEEIGAIARRCADRGYAVLMIEHNMKLVMSCCDDIYVLAAGQIIAHGSPSSVQSDPAVIQAYLGVEAC